MCHDVRFFFSLLLPVGRLESRDGLDGLDGWSGDAGGPR